MRLPGMPEPDAGPSSKSFSAAQMNEEKIAIARLSVYSNTLLVILKVIAGVIMGSVAVISEAIHSSIDLIAAVIARYSVKMSSEPADKEHRFGHGKYENLSGMVEGVLIFVAASGIIYKAVKRLLGPVEVQELPAGMAVMGISAVLNFFVARKLFKVAKKTESLALEADAYHLQTDVWTSVGVFTAFVLIGLTNQHWLDPAIAIVVAAIIIHAAYDITKRSTEGLLDKSLPDAEILRIEQIMKEHEITFVDFHKLRTRKVGSERQIDLHLTVHKNMSVKQGHDLVDHLEKEIKKEFPASIAVIHIEPCDDKCKRCPPPAPMEKDPEEQQ